jgi:hypothetical protein
MTGMETGMRADHLERRVTGGLAVGIPILVLFSVFVPVAVIGTLVNVWDLRAHGVPGAVVVTSDDSGYRFGEVSGYYVPPGPHRLVHFQPAPGGPHTVGATVPVRYVPQRPDVVEAVDPGAHDALEVGVMLAVWAALWTALGLSVRRVWRQRATGAHDGSGRTAR